MILIPCESWIFFFWKNKVGEEIEDCMWINWKKNQKKEVLETWKEKLIKERNFEVSVRLNLNYLKENKPQMEELNSFFTVPLYYMSEIIILPLYISILSNVPVVVLSPRYVIKIYINLWTHVSFFVILSTNLNVWYSHTFKYSISYYDNLGKKYLSNAKRNKRRAFWRYNVFYYVKSFV